MDLDTGKFVGLRFARFLQIYHQHRHPYSSKSNQRQAKHASGKQEFGTPADQNNSRDPHPDLKYPVNRSQSRVGQF